MDAKATTELVCFEKLKSSFKLIGRSTVNLHIYWLLRRCPLKSMLKRSSRHPFRPRLLTSPIYIIITSVLLSYRNVYENVVYIHCF